MRPDPPDTPSDEIAARLASYDEARRGGADVEPSGPAVEELKPEDLSRLRHAQACVEMLHWHFARGQFAGIEPTEGAASLGRFRVVRELVRGGHGVVYLAFDPTLDCQVALKVPRPDCLASPERRRRFLREAQAAARLHHPNLVAVHEVGEAGPVSYIASHYCAGPNRAEWIASQAGPPLSPHEAAGLVLALAEAVEHAHGRGVLHRDIKPSNILLEPADVGPQGGPGRKINALGFVPKLTDFGLAKLLEGDGEQTASGAILGTPRYMAPEQAGKRHGEVGPATDVHALGLVLYELLTGRSPFAAASDVESLAKVLNEEPTPLRRRNPSAPRDLESICGRCLEKPPSRRYPTAVALAADLRRFLDGRPVKARPIGLWRRGLKWLARNRASAFALILALTASGTGLWSTIESRRSRGLALQARRETQARAESMRRLRYVDDIRLAFQLWKANQLGQARTLLESYIPTRAAEDLRSFEWHYLNRLCQGERPPLRGHREDVYFVTFSTDGRTLASAGKDGTIRLWDPSTGRERKVLRAHGNEVNWVSFSADGRRLVSASDDETVKLWDVASGDCRGTLSGHRSPVIAALFSPDGRWVFSGAVDGAVKLWDASRQAEETTLGTHGDRINAMAVTADGRALASVGNDGNVRVWDLERRRERLKLPQDGHAFGLAISHDARTLAASSKNGFGATIRFWELASGKAVGSVTRIHTLTESLAFSPADDSLAAAGDDGVVRILDAATRSVKDEYRGHTARAWSTAFSPDGCTLASASRDGTLRFWDRRNPQGRKALDLSVSPFQVAFSADSATLSAACIDGTLRSWDVPSGRPLAVRSVGRGHPHEILELSPDSRWLCISSGTALSLLETTTGDSRWVVPVRSQMGIPPTFFPDGSRIAAPEQGGSVAIFDVASGRRSEAVPLRRASESGSPLDVSPWRRYLARPFGDQIEIWDSSTGQTRFLGQKHGLEITECEFSPGGKLLAASGTDRSVTLWDAETGAMRGELQGHSDAPLGLAFSPEGKILASGSRDYTIRLWSLATGKELLTLEGHTGMVRHLRFSADGMTLASFAQEVGGPPEGFLWRSLSVDRGEGV